MAALVDWFASDGRHFQIVSQVIFLSFGICYLSWDAQALSYFAAISAAISFQGLGILFFKQPIHSLKSALITGLGLSLLLKANDPLFFVLAAMLAIGQKFLLRVHHKHLWNPANFGIIMLMLFTDQAWVSPGQWGSETVLLFAIGTAGLAVLSKVKRMDTAMVFISVFVVLEYSRTVLYLGWGYDVFFHRLSNGSLWLFALFMITDPMTTPNAKFARMLWAAVLAILSFIGIHFFFLASSPQWLLFFLTPFTPWVDKWAKGQPFSWVKNISNNTYTTSSSMKTLSIFLAALLLWPSIGWTFCGFYVAKADATLYNNKSEVILVRDGQRTVITMSNDFKGDVQDFALVVPVPVVLQEHQIRVVDRSIFDVLDSYSAPRMAEYYDVNPCEPQIYYDIAEVTTTSKMRSESLKEEASIDKDYGVTIEASYSVGEYDILILSAQESSGLKEWLTINGYRIPPTAESILQPYIKSNMKFFVVKVNLDEFANSGYDNLRPIQIEFNHEKFMLPIRLGMANSQGTQDMIVYGFSKTGRIESTNYRTVKVPTDRSIPLFLREEFGTFYTSMFNRLYHSEGRNAVFLEYAWNVTPTWGGMKCDPCVGPPPLFADLTKAGVNWANNGSADQVFFTRMHVRYSRDKFPSDLTFHVTPNTENFQARYVIRHAATGKFSCSEGQTYLSELYDRRQLEIDEYYALCGKTDRRASRYINEFTSLMQSPPAENKGSSAPTENLPQQKDPEQKGETTGALPMPEEPGGPLSPSPTVPNKGQLWISLALLISVAFILRIAGKNKTPVRQ